MNIILKDCKTPQYRGNHSVHSTQENSRNNSFDRRRGFESGLNSEESRERAENTKNIIHLVLDDINTVKEPTINKDKESCLEENKQVIGNMQEII
ncbi:hypothetical protein CWI38_0083p0070 [Hamiltosporidium tvaerminnensis]|uniref:Uncharacterized protein n=1 Tax=Hamiltosporidium tvaerminnensis TaxID=1176355 RepID=A0A4Q9M124_9MICR|nr:hypothetical protein CWI38_0083p0070 [Hamiltosporidium tvaerminnensis]